MNIQEATKVLFNNEVLVEVANHIADTIEIIAARKESPELKEELAEMQGMKKDFEELLNDLEAGEIDDEEAQEIYDEIVDMLEGSNED